MNTSRRRYVGEFLSERYVLRPNSPLDPITGSTQYLRSAKLSIDAFESDSQSPLNVQLAHFPQLTFAMLTTPPVRVTWHRNRASVARGLILLTRTGAIDVESTARMVTRSTGAAVIAPGTDPIRIRTLSRSAELIYISVTADVLPAALATLRSPVDLPPIGWPEVAPMYAFISALVDASATVARDPRAYLAVPAEQVSRSLALALTRGVIDAPTLLERARHYLDENFADHSVSLMAGAAALSVAPRTLQAAFAATNTTFTAELRHRRVAAFWALRAKSPDMRLVDIVAAVGFSSKSAMYRAIRAAEVRDASR